MPPLDTIIFDAGGTLVFLDTIRISRLVGYDQPDAPERLSKAWYPTMRAYDDMLLATGKHWLGDPNENIWMWFWNQMVAAAGLPSLDEAAVGRIIEANRERSLWDQSTDEVRQVLEDLHQRYKLAVVSNSDGTVAAKLRDIGLGQYFSVIVDSHIVGVSKPDPAIFTFALQSLGSDPERSAYIGDSYSMDYRGASRAGLRPILLDPERLNLDRGVERIEALNDLLRLL